MLLTIEALLLISAALGQDHRAAVEGQISPLDMAPNSVDDQYEGCTEKMRNLVETKYLEKEISQPESNFSKLWEKGLHKTKKQEDNLTTHHLVAFYIYTTSEFLMYRDFNNAVRSEKQKYKDGTFSWYSLHFLLTDAIQTLKKTQNRCYSTYRGTPVKFDKDVLNKEIRFGSFTSSSLNRYTAKNFGTKSCFEIYTCEGAAVGNYSVFANEKEVLIPPYEKFNVTAVKTRIHLKDLWCETVYTLQSSGKNSELNCIVANSAKTNLTIIVIIIIIIILFVLFLLMYYLHRRRKCIQIAHIRLQEDY